MGVVSELINPAMLRTRNGRVTSTDDTSKNALAAFDLYADIVRTSMGLYPWPFLTKTVTLEPAGGTDDIYREYRNRFALPSDYLYIFEFYDHLDRSRPSYPYSYNFSDHYQPFTYPLTGYDAEYGKLGRIVGNEFRSDCSEIFALYIPRPPEDDGERGLVNADISSWSIQFREYVKKELMVALEQGLSTDAEVSVPYIAMHRRDKKKMETQAAVENRKGHRLKEPSILSRMRTGR